MIENENIDYNEILLNAIPYLKRVNSFSGGEGTVYFLNDDFVIKKYNNVGDWKCFDLMFIEFCSEMEKIGMDTNYPKIYAWQKVPNIGYFYKGDKNKFDFYILEERVKGRDLYYGFLQDSYEVAKDLCSEKDYLEALYNPEDYFSLFKKIASLYIEDYIKMNEIIESLSDADIEKLLMDFWIVDSSTQYLSCDIHPSNILINDNMLRPIDPTADYKQIRKGLVPELKDMFINKILLLFWANDMCLDDTFKNYFHYEKDMIDGQLKEFQNKNMRVCKAALIKFLRVMNRVLDNPLVINRDLFFNSLSLLEPIFNSDKQEINDIIKEVKFLS